MKREGRPRRLEIDEFEFSQNFVSKIARRYDGQPTKVLPLRRAHG